MKTYGIGMPKREKRKKRDKKPKNLNTKMNKKKAEQIKYNIKNDYFRQL